MLKSSGYRTSSSNMTPHREPHENIATDLMIGVPTMVHMVDLAGRGMMGHHMSNTQIQTGSVDKDSTSLTNSLKTVSLVKRPIAAGGLNIIETTRVAVS